MRPRGRHRGAKTEASHSTAAWRARDSKQDSQRTQTVPAGCAHHEERRESSQSSFAVKSRFDRTMRESTRGELETARLKVDERIDAGGTGAALAAMEELAGSGKHGRLRQAVWNGSGRGELKAALAVGDEPGLARGDDDGFGHQRQIAQAVEPRRVRPATAGRMWRSRRWIEDAWWARSAMIKPAMRRRSGCASR